MPLDRANGGCAAGVDGGDISGKRVADDSCHFFIWLAVVATGEICSWSDGWQYLNCRF